MESPDSTSEDPIGSATSVQAIIDALARRGCADLTPSIDLDVCSQFPIAGGGFCDVFRGALHVGTRIAIKCLRVYDGSEAEGDSEKRKLLKRAAREIYHWSKLQHRNVLPLLGLAIFRGGVSMVSEWMGNGNLMTYLRLNPDVDRNKLCMDVCEGLCYIHVNEMVHGDLKAANVVVSSEGVALIADFGNAQLKDLTLKFTGTTRGGLSVRWAAPELLLEDGGPQVSKEADVYAYGMVVLEVVTGKVPFEGASDNRVICLVAYEQKVPLRPEIDMHADLWKIINLCWTREPSQRPQITSVKHLLQGLSSRPSFGVPVTDQLARDGTEQPKILSKCVQAIEKYGLDSVRIYRPRGPMHRVWELKELLDRNLDAVDLDSSEWSTGVHNVALVLKLWVDELPEPLMTWELYDSFIEAAQIEDKRLRNIRLREHVNALPDANYSTLKYLIVHLYRVSERCQVNQMSRFKLACAFGWTLLRPRGVSTNMGESRWHTQDEVWSCRVVEAMLNNYVGIFAGR